MQKKSIVKNAIIINEVLQPLVERGMCGLLYSLSGLTELNKMKLESRRII